MYADPKYNAMVMGVVTALVGVLASITPFGMDLEEDLGLGALFKLRGSRSAPAEVVIVTADRRSAYDLRVPEQPWKWPRSLHGRLVRKLDEQGARVIAFDLFFEDPSEREEQDHAFAEAMREAGNVVLFQWMTTYGESRGPPGVLKWPTVELAKAAAALAPFPLPREGARVNQVWLFEPSLGHAPTLPLVAFQLHALPVYENLLGLLREASPELARQLPSSGTAVREGRGAARLASNLRAMFIRDPSLADTLLTELEILRAGSPSGNNALLASLIKAYSRGDSQYLDLYGPRFSITTVPYSCILESCQEGRAPSVNFAGKVVFVGLSERMDPELVDPFPTVFGYFSGVEIAAAAFANLLEDRQVRPLNLWLHLLVVIAWGMLVTVAFGALPPASLVRTLAKFGAVYLAAGAAYLGMAYYSFEWHALWLPTVVPLALQLHVGLLGTLFWRYREAQRERENIQTSPEYFFPRPFAEQLSRSVKAIKAKGELVEGICLSTDAEHYTGLAESLEPEDLHAFMNEYYETVFDPVRRRGGDVSHVIGDAVLAIWPAASLSRELRTKACEAALDILTAVKKFNEMHRGTPLPTRMGLHGGRILLGTVGGTAHYEYRPVGDVISTACRLEGLNKHLGTRTLASKTVLDGVEGFLSRELGWFQVVGRIQPILVYELICRDDEADFVRKEAVRAFSVGLDAFRGRRWNEAIEAFHAYIAGYGDDGPSRFYLQLCERYRSEPPPDSWEGVIAMSQK